MAAAKQRTRAILILYVLCALYLVPVFPHFLSANELTRWAAAVGLVEHGTLEVSWAEPLIGPPMDVARSGGRLYSNKAPGLTFLATVPYALARPLLGPPSQHNLRWSLYLMRVATVTVPALVLGVLLSRRCRHDPLPVATALFATPVFIFGTLFFSHVAAAMFLYAASLLVLPEEPSGATSRRTALGGLLAGLATLTEYPAALGVLALAAVLAVSRDRIRRLPSFVAGGLPIAVALALYNTALFGSPFSLSSAHEASPDLAAQASAGLYGIAFPSLARLEGLLLSPSRGLFFFSPILVFGLLALAPRRPYRSRDWFRLVFVSLLLVAMAGYPGWHGGWGAGARYLLLAVPFLVEAAYDRAVGPGLLTALFLVCSVVLCVSPVLTLPLVPNDFELLHATFTRPLLSAGFATPNFGWLAASGLATLVPVLVAAAFVIVLALYPVPRRAVLGVLFGTILAAGVFLVPVEPKPQLTALRALFLDTHFTPADRLGAMLRRSRDPRVDTVLESLRRASGTTRAFGADDWPYAGRLYPAISPRPPSADAGDRRGPPVPAAMPR